jgi:hypothetical protein
MTSADVENRDVVLCDDIEGVADGGIAAFHIVTRVDSTSGVTSHTLGPYLLAVRNLSPIRERFDGAVNGAART